jgi:hypothetical protein
VTWLRRVDEGIEKQQGEGIPSFLTFSVTYEQETEI